jgi:hypothetical protein
LPAAADDQLLGQRKAEKPGLIEITVEFAYEVADHAIDAAGGGVELLMVVARLQEDARLGGHIDEASEPVAGAHIGEIEMDPVPTGAAGIRVEGPVDRKLLGFAVGADAEGVDEAGNDRLPVSQDRGRGGGTR